MKKSGKFGLYFMLLIIFGQMSECNMKDHYIDKYFGRWDFTVINKITDYYSVDESSDTVFFEGVINPGSSDNKLIIQYSDQNQMEVEVDEGGNLIMYCGRPSECSGRFEDAYTFEYQYSARVNNGQTVKSYLTIIYGKKHK